MRRSSAKRRGCCANALSEYALIAGIVLLGSLGVIYMIGGNFNLSMASLKNDLKANITASETAAFGPLPESLWDNAGLLSSAGAQQKQVCFQAGFCLNMPIISGGQVTTAGGLGSDEVEAIANMLWLLARQLEAEGADPGLVAKITALANRGHGVSNSLRVTAQDYRTKVDYLQANPNNPGMNFGNDFNLSITTNQANISSRTREFQQAWWDVQSEIARAAPSPSLTLAKAIIDVQAREIVNISDSVTRDNIDYSQLAADPGLDMMANVTHQDANTICQTGGNMGQCYVNTGSGWQTP